MKIVIRELHQIPCSQLFRKIQMYAIKREGKRCIPPDDGMPVAFEAVSGVIVPLYDVGLAKIAPSRASLEMLLRQRG